MDSGIYRIVNLVNGHRYIGSAVNLPRRWIEHKYRLRRGDHHSKYLQRSWEKHGPASFSFETLLICEKRDLLFYEQRCIDGLGPEYNIAAIAGSSLGRATSAETRRKLSIALTGIKRSDETKRLMSKVAQTRKRPPPVSIEARQRMSLAWRGRKWPPRTEVHQARLSEPRRMFSDAQIREIRALSVAGTKQAEIARQFGCSAALVCTVISRKRYAWVI